MLTVWIVVLFIIIQEHLNRIVEEYEGMLDRPQAEAKQVWPFKLSGEETIWCTKKKAEYKHLYEGVTEYRIAV